MKILELGPAGNKVRVWISSDFDISNDLLWHQKALYKDIVDNVGCVQPVRIIGG